MAINTTTYKGHTSIGPILTLDDLRKAVVLLKDLPRDTPIRLPVDDDNSPDSYALVKELVIAPWDGETQCGEGDEEAGKAIFVG